MTNYTQSIDFSDKDALPTGNPSKLGRGSDLDTELGLISTAIVSKEDSANKGAVSGYAGLVSGNVPRAQLPAALAYEDEANSFTTTQTISSINPILELNETDAAVDNRLWTVSVQTEQLLLRVLNDAKTLATVFLAVDRTGQTVDSIAWTVTNMTLNGVNVRDTSILSTGTLADARVAQSNVIQHQAALVIAESQITDGAILARLNAVSDFTTAPTIGGVGISLVGHAHAAADVTSGIFADARIPSLDTSKITTGTLADARVALSNVSQHASSIKTRNLPGSAGTNVTLQLDPGGTPAGSPGEVFEYF